MFTLLYIHCIFIAFIINPQTNDWLINLGLHFNSVYTGVSDSFVAKVLWGWFKRLKKTHQFRMFSSLFSCVHSYFPYVSY